MIELPELFRGFEERLIDTGEVEIFARIGGSGPPLLLLHGYPQTHVHYHRLAPLLADRFTVICADLRGYGSSSIPASDPEHKAYSKRAMAGDMVRAMAVLGHDTFAVGGHDRGGRVAYRMALDLPDVVVRLVLMDIVPTVDVWDAMGWGEAIGAYHWPFLAQPHPLPETLMSAAAEFYADWTLRSWTGSQDLSVFDARALTHYRAQMADPARVHAMCEDYRAGATIDRALDAADREAGRTIAAPTLLLWSEKYLVAKSAEPPPVTWARWCEGISDVPIEAGHFLAEENPQACAEAILAWFET